jgi:hypothetical protein
MDDPQLPIEPPPQFVAYPRHHGPIYGSSVKLKALYSGYTALGNLLVLNFFLGVIPLAAAGTADDNAKIVTFGVWAVLLGILVGLASYRTMKDIGFGANWPAKGPVVASAAIGINSAFFCGLFGYVVIQHLAWIELARYGLKTQLVGGVLRKDVEKALMELEAREQTPVFADYMPTSEPEQLR